MSSMSTSNSCLRSYSSFCKKAGLSSNEMFQLLSLEVGGDSDSISRIQLDTYLNKAKDGVIEINPIVFDALIELQDNWNNISTGRDFITVNDMSDYNDILMDIVAGEAVSPKNDLFLSLSPADDFYSFLLDSSSFSKAKDISNDDFSLVLKSLLEDSESDEKCDGELIDSLTDMISLYSSVSAVEI